MEPFNTELEKTCHLKIDEIILEEGKYYWFSNNSGVSYPEVWSLRKLERIENNDFVSYNDYTEKKIIYHYAIKQSDFNPNNMKETLKYIIKIKDDKFVKLNK